MKKILVAFSLILAAGSTMAQEKLTPSIKKGSKLNYTIYTDGQTMPLYIAVDSLSAEYVKLLWSIEGMGNGGWIMKKASVESATEGYWSQPQPGNDEVLADNTAVLILSKAQWKQISTEKKLNYSGATFTVKTTDTTPIKIAGKTVDAIQLEGPGGNTKLWVLNSPAFPLLLKVQGNPHEVDIEVTGIE